MVVNGAALSQAAAYGYRSGAAPRGVVDDRREARV
jgi:hypothetical protein